MSNCCLCGKGPADWCNPCRHYFCEDCRTDYFWRGAAALKEWFLDSPPRHCTHPPRFER
jgi:hypothetical protein